MDQHKNFGSSTVATAPSPATSGLSLIVQAGDGVKFPTAPFNATIRPAGVAPTTANAEIVRVTAKSTDTFTILRAQENSTARTVVVGDVIAATITTKAFTDIEGAFGTSTFRTMRLRTHQDQDVAASKVSLLSVEEVVMNDGSRYQPTAVLPLVGDITVSGAGGLDTGSEQGSTWYEIYLIGKSTTQSTSDLALLLHRSKDYFKDTSFVTPFDSSQQLRLAAGTPTDKLAQGIQFPTGGKVQFIDLTVARINVPSGRVWVTLEADNSGSPSGTPLATSDKLNAAVFNATQVNYVRFPFRLPATLSAATQYHWVVQGDYTRSDTVNLVFGGVAAGGYANGTAKKFNGSVWSTIAGLGDFQFSACVVRNDTAVTMPSGYDQRCLLGYVYNDGSSNFVGFIASDRRVRRLAPQVITSLSSSFNIPLLWDTSNIVPPIPVDMFTTITNTTVTNNFVWGVPDGYNATAISSAFDGGASIVTNSTTPGWSNMPPIATEFQALYYTIGAGSGTISCTNWIW